MPQEIPVKDCFSKGMVDGKGRNKMPIQFASYIRNARIDNGSIGPRNGFINRIESNLGTYMRGIKGNDIMGKLMVVTNGRLYTVNTTTRSYTDIGALASGDTDVNFINHGKYTIILTGASKPYVYDGTTLTLTTSTSPDVNPRIGARFAGFTCFAGNTATTKNILYMSRPVTLANPEYVWDRVGTGANTITFATEILGIIGTNNNLFVFTKESIEQITRDQIDTTGGVASFYSIPVSSEGDVLISEKCIAGVGDKVFYMTKGREIKTLNYVSGTIDASVGDLSDRELININSFMSNINETQSTPFAIVKGALVEWHIRTYNSLINNIVLIYDTIHDSWLVDSNKYFGCGTKYNNEYYFGSALNSNLYLDESGKDDDGIGTPFVWKSPVISFGNPTRLKFFKGIQLAGEMNQLAEIDVSILIDGNTICSRTITAENILPGIINGIASNPVAGVEVAGASEGTNITLYPFEKVLDHGQINFKGKNIQIVIEADNVGQDFYFDFLNFLIDPVGRYELKDQL